MEYTFKYGIKNNNIDITKLVMHKCSFENIIMIPKSDHCRALLFTDPLPNILKSIFVMDNEGKIVFNCLDTQTVYIDSHNGTIYNDTAQGRAKLLALEGNLTASN